MNRAAHTKILPFIITPVITLLDQITKYLISINLGIQEVAFSFFNGFLQIIHERNTGIALSLGASLPYWVRFIIFALLPLGVLGYACYYTLKTSTLTTLQRFAIAGIIGGGLGNIIDRIFRTQGVIDFISFRLYGLFGLSHFPTFNIADSALSISAGLFVFTLLVQTIKKTRPAE
ncbi:MAG: signal peptidase II [Spirochaetales bacterium]|nr:signal peptidase II [Spirochaetales bacterium]